MEGVRNSNLGSLVGRGCYDLKVIFLKAKKEFAAKACARGAQG